MSERSNASKARAHQRDGHLQRAQADPAAMAQEPLRRLASSAGNRAVSELLGQGRPLPDALRLPLEARFDEDFSQVRIHDHAQAHASAGAQGAKAYTHGEDIVFGAQRFVPDRTEGRHLLAHELAHVVQQRRGGPVPVADGGAAPHEQAASAAADALTQGSGPVTVAGATGVGVACEKDDEEEKKGQASSTVLNQQRINRPKKNPLPQTPPAENKSAATPKPTRVEIVDAANKGKGVAAEVTVPFDAYAGPEWNHIGGGSETASSRTSLARRSWYDDRYGLEEGSAGIDFIVENTRTGLLVIGEQKSTDKKQFVDAGAITTNLEVNLGQAVTALKGQLEVVRSKNPDQAAALERTIARLEATQKAVAAGSELPPGVVFELTNIGGAGEQIGKGHIDLLTAKYEGKPGLVEHLLSRTFIRDPALAKRINQERAEKGLPPMDAEPGTVPANEVLTEQARNELARLKAGKTPQEWEEQQTQERADREAKETDANAKAVESAREERKKATRERNAANKKEQDEARDKAAAERLQALRDERRKNNEPEPQNKTAQKKRDSADRSEAAKAGREAKAEVVKNQKAEAERQRAAADARKKADEAAAAQQRADAEAKAQAEHEAYERRLADARKILDEMKGKPPEDWDKLPKETRADLEKLATDAQAAPNKQLGEQQKELARQYKDLHGELNRQQTQDFADYADRQNNPEPAKTPEPGAERPRVKSNDEKLGAAAHRMNQAAGALRGVDAYLDARDRGEGYGSALLSGGWSYLANTNQAAGAIETFRSRMQTEKLPDGRQQQYYGEDAGDAFFGTLGENIAGFIVPGKGWDQAVNGAANLIGAADDHMKRDLAPDDPARHQANLRTGTDLLAEVTPSRMFASTIGAGLRSYYDLGKALGGQTSGVDRFAEDGVRGKLGSIIQPWAMLADFAGNLGGDDAGTALEKTLKKSEGSTLSKLGNRLGDGMYELGESQDAKAGKYGAPVQGLSMMLGMSSDMIGGMSFEKALDKAAEAGKDSTLAQVGNAMGDATFKAVETGREVYDEGKKLVTEDLPALKEAAKDRARQEYEAAKEKLSRWWND